MLEDYNDGAHPTSYGEINTNPEGLGDGVQEIVPDPLDPDNLVNLAVADVPPTNFSNFHLGWFELERPILDGEVVTFYHRHLKEGFFADAAWGFVDQPPPTAPEFYSFNAFESLVRYSTLTGAFFDIRNGAEYVNLLFPELNTWYEIWMVIDHSSDTTDLYVKGGEFVEQTLLHSGAAFRNISSTDPLSHFLLITVTGTAENPRGVDPFYIDDL